MQCLGDWESYERTYLSDRNTFEQATSDDDFQNIISCVPLQMILTLMMWLKSCLPSIKQTQATFGC